MFEELFLKSMVKGIGKTTGSMIVLGIIGGGILYASSSKKSTMKSKKRVKETKGTQTVQMEEVEENTQLDQVKQLDQVEQLDIDTVSQITFLESENRYKEILDKLR